MTIIGTFQFASGSVPGRHHLGHHPNLVGLNNQDSMGMRVTDDYAILVVSDGCGAGDHSEVGSNILTRITLNAFEMLLRTPFGCDPFSGMWCGIAFNEIRDRLRSVASVICDRETFSSRDFFYRQHFLATLMVAVVTPKETAVLSIGDGVYAVNGDVTELDPGAGNMPAYIAYGLMADIQAPLGSHNFTVLECLPTCNVDSLLIGTDGIGDLIAKENEHLPGNPSKKAGPLSWFWSTKAFKTSVRVHQRLRLINREVARERPGGGIEIHRGLLPDDTTLISMRRR